MSNIFIDIETVPVQRHSMRDMIAADLRAEAKTEMADVKAPGNYKDPAKIADYIAVARADIEASLAAKIDKAILDTSFDGGLGQIVCISAAVEDEAPVSFFDSDLTLSTEAFILSSFFDWLRSHASGTRGTRPRLIGHNHVSFDIPFIWKRAIIHGFKPPIWFPRDPKPWGDDTADTMTMWAGARGRISMDRLCKLLGIDGKADGPTGADVWPMAQAGRFEEIAHYCAADVERTRQIFNRLTFNV